MHTREIFLRIVEIKGVLFYVLENTTAEEVEQNPNLQEAIKDMAATLKKTGQTMGIIPGDATSSGIDLLNRSGWTPIPFGEKLRWLRERDKLTQVAAAEKFAKANSWSKCRQSTWANWEARDTAPRGQVLEAIAAMFGVRSSFFYLD